MQPDRGCGPRCPDWQQTVRSTRSAPDGPSSAPVTSKLSRACGIARAASFTDHQFTESGRTPRAVPRRSGQPGRRVRSPASATRCSSVAIRSSLCSSWVSRTADSAAHCKYLVARGAVLPGERAELSPALGNLFQPAGLALQAVQVARQVGGEIAELVARTPPTVHPTGLPAGSREAADSKDFAGRVEHGQCAAGLIIWPGECLNG